MCLSEWHGHITKVIERRFTKKNEHNGAGCGGASEVDVLKELKTYRAEEL